MIKRLGHLCLRTHQLSAMVAFYRDVLGLTVKFGLKHDDGTEFGYYMAAGDTTFVEIFDHARTAKPWGGEAGTLKPNLNTCYNHSCLEVTGLEALVQSLEAKGVKVRPIAIGMDHSKQ